MSRRIMKNYDSDKSDDEFQNPHTHVQTTTDRAESTNTSVISNTSFNGSTRTIRRATTSRTVTQQQVKQVTEIKTTFETADINEINKRFPELGAFGFDPPLSASSSRRFASNFQIENTTVTQNKGGHVTSTVFETCITQPRSPDNHHFSSFDNNLDAQKPSMIKRVNSTFSNTQRPDVDAQPYGPKGAITQTNKIYIPVNSFEAPESPRKNTYQQSQFGTIPKSPSTPSLKKTLSSFPKPSVPSTAQKPKPGLAYIFNNENFDDEKNGSRIGTDADSDSLRKTLSNLKLTVEVHKDASLSKIKTIVKKITNKDFTGYSCLVIAILTHGSRNERVHARDKSYSIDDDILFPIMKNVTLSNKPKILFIQACKGFMEVEDFHKDKPLLNGTPSEILKCYSTFEGYVSYRTEQGTFFIQKLCEELQKNGETLSIQEIMRLVTHAVKQFTKGKQIPTMTVNLTEDFVFGDYM